MQTLSARYISHTVRTDFKPAERSEISVVVANTGEAPWDCQRSNANVVYLAAWVNGTPCAAGFFEQEFVAPGERAVVLVSVTAPAVAGLFSLKLGLVQQGVAFFEDWGVDPILVEPEVQRENASSRASCAPVIPKYRFELVDHRVPERVSQASRFKIWVRVRNTGAMTWEQDRQRGRLVSAVVMLAGQVVGGVVLSRPVPYNDVADFHIVACASGKAGRHRLTIGLVHEGVGFFEAFGAPALSLEVDVGSAPPTRTARLYDVACRHNSWFFQPSGGISESRNGASYPVILDKAEGCYVWDTTGRRYIDFTMGWGCALLGHRYEPVQSAVRAALDLGTTLPLPHAIEMDVTQMLCEDIPCAEAVAFGKNGSDACSLAIRLARVVTGRRTVLTCGYHGWQDWYAESLGFTATGVPERERALVHRFPFNNIPDFQRILHDHEDDLAAIILEPSGGAGSGYRPSEDADPEFLRIVAAEARRVGAVLIFDEIMTGFRYHSGGLQRFTGVIPDLACFGKALANGMPISAVVGCTDLLREIKRTFYGPTFKGEVLSLAAAKACLATYRSQPVAEHVWNFGASLKERLNEIARELRLAAVTVGPPFRFALAFQESDPVKLSLKLTLYVQELLRGGIIPYYGYMLPSFAHNDAVLARTVDVAGDALAKVAIAERTDTFHQMIEIPPIEVRL